MTEQSKRVAFHGSRLRSAEVVRNVWHLTPEAGTPVETLADPSFWAHVARMMRPGDLIEAIPDDMAWRAELIVGRVVGLKVYVAILNHAELRFIEPTGIAEYRIEWKGPHHKHAIVDASAKTTIKAGFENKDAAAAWLNDYLKRAA